MAQLQTDRPSAGEVRANSLGKLTYAVASVVSVGLVIGMGVWGYKLLVRDVSGVPVIRAAEGPMRIQPDDPGGDQALHQGLAVNAVAAAGSAEAAADRLILAPAPLDLDLEDVATASDPPMQVTGLNPAPPAPTAASVPPPTADRVTDDAAMMALAEALSDGVSPLDGAASQEDRDEDQTEELAAEQTQTAPARDGLGRSLRPRQRPAILTNVQTVSGPAATEAAGEEVDPESIAVGTRLAQLGAYKSEEIAREEWTRLSARFEDYLGGKSRVIQKAESGGRTFYRLRAMGFDDLAEARRFCSALVAEKAECIPVVAR